MKAMRLLTHEANLSIPDGLAMLVIDDRGWVGTNLGCPFHGKPAMFPEAQARAIAYAWNSFYLDGHELSADMPADLLEWLA